MNAPPAFAPPGLRSELHALAGRVRRLVPDNRNPERFHEEKSEIAGRLSGLAGGGQPRPAPLSQGARLAPPRVVTVVRVVHVPTPRRYLRAPTRHRFPKPPKLPAETQPVLL